MDRALSYLNPARDFTGPRAGADALGVAELADGGRLDAKALAGLVRIAAVTAPWALSAAIGWLTLA